MVVRSRLRFASAGLSIGANVLGTKIVNYALGALTAILVARVLGPEDRGIWSVTLLIASVFGLCAEMGIGTSALYAMQRHPERKDAIITTSLLLAFGISTCWVLLGLTLATDARVLRLIGVPATPLVIAIVAAIGVGATSVSRYILLKLDDTQGANRSSLVHAGSLLILLAVAFIADPGVDIAMAAYSLSVFATLAFTLPRLFTRHHVRFSPEPRLFGPLFSYGAKAHLSSVALFLVYRVDLVIVNHYLGFKAAGIYSVSLAVSEILRGIPETAQTLVVTRSGRGLLATDSERMCRMSVIVTAVCGVVVATSSEWLIPLVFGPAYAGASTALWWLLPGSLGLAASYSLSPLLALRGQVMTSGWATLLSLVVMVGIDVYVVPWWGLSGAAIASSIAYCMLAGLQLGLLCRSGEVWLGHLVPKKDDFRHLSSI